MLDGTQFSGGLLGARSVSGVGGAMSSTRFLVRAIRGISRKVPGVISLPSPGLRLDKIAIRCLCVGIPELERER